MHPAILFYVVLSRWIPSIPCWPSLVYPVTCPMTSAWAIILSLFRLITGLCSESLQHPFTFIYCVHICVYGYRCARALKWRPKGQRTIYRNRFSPSSLWIQGLELRLTDMAASSFTHLAILIAPILPRFSCYTHFFFLNFPPFLFDSSL